MTFEFEFKNEKKKSYYRIKSKILIIDKYRIDKSKFYRSLYSINFDINRYVL